VIIIYLLNVIMIKSVDLHTCDYCFIINYNQSLVGL